MSIMSHFCLPVLEKIEFNLELILERRSVRIMRKGKVNTEDYSKSLLTKRSMNVV